MKDITNKNNKGELHGYQEWYHHNHTIWLRGNVKNGVEIGYEEIHLKHTTYYIK